MDSHADTCVAGKNWSVMSYSDVVCEVSPFTDEYESIKEVPIVTACTVWTDSNTGKEYLLVGDQFLFGLNLQGPAYTFCDNAGVVKNVSVPESVLHKRHNAINYHVVREAVAAKIMIVGKEDGDTNLADLFTKILTGERRNMLCGYLFR